MKAIVIVFLVGWLTQTVMAETYDVRDGTFEAPEGFVFKHTGTKDSFMGTLTRRADGFTITFDVGWMAGVHMSDAKKPDCTFYRRHSVGGIPASTGIQRAAAGRRITTTVDYDRATNRQPANFWAEVRDESDVAEFLLIVTTYKAKPGEKSAGAAIPQPENLSMTLAWDADAPGPRQYVFVVNGLLAYRTIDGLRNYLKNIPKGSSLAWAPGCSRMGDEPLLSSEADMRRFREFCQSCGIKLTIVPAG